MLDLHVFGSALVPCPFPLSGEKTYAQNAEATLYMHH